MHLVFLNKKMSAPLLEDAKLLISDGCFAITEGSNMPLTPEAIDYVFEEVDTRS